MGAKAMFRSSLCLAAALMCVSPVLSQSPPPAAPNPLPTQIINQSQPLPDTKPATKSALHEENLTPIHPQLIDLQWRDESWQLVDDNVTIKDFGRREHEARAALGLIRELGLTQRGTIGSPQPIMEYWLANGHAPSGLVRSLRPRPIDLATLRVEEAQKQWVVRDNYQILFNFGAQEQDARQAAAVLHHYGFTQIGVLGAGAPSMLVLFGSSEQTARPLSAHVPPESRFGTGAGAAKEQLTKEPNSFPVLQHISPLRPHDADKKDGNHESAPSIASLPQGRQLSQPSQLVADTDALIECVPFDWRQLQARKEGQDWQLRAGQYAIAHFGSDHAAADKALSILQFYHCTEQCQIGGPQPVFTYFLANGQAPRGQMLGLGGIAIQCDALKIHPVGEAWAISDGTHILFTFDKEQSAKQVLQAMQKHKFDHLCRIGHGETQAMTFLLRMN
jgi:hypothetical protein